MSSLILNRMNLLARSFGFESAQEYILSIFPSFKYGLTSYVILFSSISAICENVFGLKGITVVAFAIMLIAEFSSGIWASRIARGEQLRSIKLGRFVFKLFIWLTCFFIINAFAVQYKDNSFYSFFYTTIHAAALMIAAKEYLVSIMENMALIAGKKKGTYAILFKKKINQLLAIPEEHPITTGGENAE